MSNQILYQMVVEDVNDPLMLGRIRCRPLPDDKTAVTNSQPIPPSDLWTLKDPFLFKPFLPYFFYQVPIKDELVYCIYYNSDVKYRNQYYIQSTLSSPVNSTREIYSSAQRTTTLGIPFQNAANLKLSGTTKGQPWDGVFPEPGDNAVLGRGRADIIIKENEVLLRAAKTTSKLEPGTFPTANIGRSFLQLSQFDKLKEYTGDKNFINFESNTVLVNYLIEWVVSNPDNNFDKFTGQVLLFKLKPDARVNSANLHVDSKIDDLKSLVMLDEFFNLSYDEVVVFINKFIRDCNSGNKLNGKKVFPDDDVRFPIYYRPSNQMYTINVSPPLSNSSSDIQRTKTIKKIYPNIYLYPGTLTPGYGLIWKFDTVGEPYNVKKTKEQTYQFKTTPTTFGSMGADYLVLISHQSKIDGKRKINLENTIYGIDDGKFSDEIMPNTSSMVRGEELLELLNKIVYFLVTHTHSYPLLPPDEETYTDSNVADLLAALNEASSKVLNKNIRLN